MTEDYSPIKWKDHIIDSETQEVIQQGTPQSAGNFNHMEEAISLGVLGMANNKDALRAAIHSGVIKHDTIRDINKIDGYSVNVPSYLNKIALAAFDVHVNGDIIHVSGSEGFSGVSAAWLNALDVDLPDPPTEGERDDLVFLEAWKEKDENGKTETKWRIRTVAGVDFEGLEEGLGFYTTEQRYDYTVQAQGGNSQPLSYDNITDRKYWAFFDCVKRNDTGWATLGSQVCLTDVGLYVAGIGDQASADILKTVDGYCYAIPLFRVHRRNSGGYSVENGNGAREYFTVKLQAPLPLVKLSFGETQEWTVDTEENYNKIEQGDIFILPSDSIYRIKIISKTIDNKVIIQNCCTIPTRYFNDDGAFLFGLFKYSRPDNLFANIIAERDIIDLRHKVSLTGFNYQQLLEENFDKLLRGELQTKEKTKMLKTYHGIRKTPIDSNTVFYASFDGTTTAEVGGEPVLYGIATYLPVSTGIGLKSTSGNKMFYAIPYNDILTIDHWAFGTGSVVLLNKNKEPLIYLSSAYLRTYFSAGDWNSKDLPADNPLREIGVETHVRIVLNNNTHKAIVYINGVKLGEYNDINPWYGDVSELNIVVGDLNGVITYPPSLGCSISDLMISDIDRGDVFATLPQDFIDGYARIENAFTGQRKQYADPLTSQYTLGIAKGAGTGHTEGITATQVTGGQWATSDTIKVKGKGGEIISGVIDTDTALAKVVGWVDSVNYIVDDITKLSVNDIVRNWYAPTNMTSSSEATILAIDTETKKVTCNTQIIGENDYQYSTLIETTADTSSPVVKFNPRLNKNAQSSGTSISITLDEGASSIDDYYNGCTITIKAGNGVGQSRTIINYTGSNKIATLNSGWDDWATSPPNATSVFDITNKVMDGTWSGLGTNEATFTVGSDSGSELSTSDVSVEYSLNCIAGQGGIPEVLTETLAGEYSGKKLIVGDVAVTDDFAGKVNGSTTVNPNIAYVVGNTNDKTLQSPVDGDWVKFGDAGVNYYNNLECLDGNLVSRGSYTDGGIAQQLFSFDLIRIVEDKYGTIPALDTAGKVQWLKDNIEVAQINCYCYGSCPSGNSVTLVLWGAISNKWVTETKLTNSSPSVIYLNRTIKPINSYTTVDNCVGSDGFVHALIYTDASDGVTASAIYTDYVNIEVKLKGKDGYDMLVPENTRRDDGRSAILLVRKETKEIETYFPNLDENDKVVTYGGYMPWQLYDYPSNWDSYKYLVNDYVYLLTEGSGAARSRAYDTKYLNAVNKIIDTKDIDNLKAYDFTCDILTPNIELPQYLIGMRKVQMDLTHVRNQYNNPGVYCVVPSDLVKGVNYLGVLLFLKVVDGELKGVLYIRTSNNTYVNKIGIGGSTVTLAFDLQGRPLVKEV